MEILNSKMMRRKRFGARSILVEFASLTIVLVFLVIFLSQITVQEASSRYGILKASYWDAIPYEMVPVTGQGEPTEVYDERWSGDRRLVYENGQTQPGFAHFTIPHKLKGGFYLMVEHAAPYVYTMILFGGGMFLFYRRRVQKPLQTMITAADRVASGNLDFHMDIRRRDEFGQISEAFEKMRVSIEQSNRENWRIAEERKRLNAAFSHDLRTPLAVLKGRVEELATFYPLGKFDQQETMAAISALLRNTDRLERYVTSMTSIQKLEDFQPKSHKVELTELAEEVHEVANALSGSKTVNVNNVLPGRLNLDVSLIFRVLENLMANAERFATESISVTLKHTEESFTIIVHDDGPGFTSKDLRRAADPYYRGEEVRSDIHFGLGLYLCSLLCEKHEGNLNFSNSPSGGAEVTATFHSLPSA